MAQGGVATDKSPSPPKIEWPETNGALSDPMNGSLTEQLQRMIVRKSVTNSADISEGATNSLSTSSSSSSSSSNGTDIKKLIKDRDDMWREHAKNQIAFMQNEHSRMLQGLHEEVERLQLKCADLAQQLADKDAITEREEARDVSSSRIEDLEKKLKITRSDLSHLQEFVDRKDLKIISLEQKWNDLEQHYKNEVQLKNSKIKDLSTELAQKSAAFAQLTNQLHQLRLKEAVERQKNEQTVRQQNDYPPIRFLRANGTIAKNASSSSTNNDVPMIPVPPANAPRKHRPGFRVGTVVTTESAGSPRSSIILPPISASSTNSIVSAGMNIEKPTNNNGSATKQATITTKTTFRTSLKRVQSTNEEQKTK